MPVNPTLPALVPGDVWGATLNAAVVAVADASNAVETTAAGKAATEHTHSQSDTTNPLTPTDLHATYGDHFAGSSLDAKWHRANYVSGDETYQQGPGATWLDIVPRPAGAYYYQSGVGLTSFSLVARFMTYANSGSLDFGLLVTDNSGNGGGCSMHATTSPLDCIAMLRLTAGVFNTTFVPAASWGGGSVAHSGTPHWLKLTHLSGVLTCSYSLNGWRWSDQISYTPPAFTVQRVGFGGLQGTYSAAAIDFFDVQ